MLFGSMAYSLTLTMEAVRSFKAKYLLVFRWELTTNKGRRRREKRQNDEPGEGRMPD
jgi:hypothetical protein